jgi:hypothetical protein
MSAAKAGAAMAASAAAPIKTFFILVSPLQTLQIPIQTT